MQKLVVIDEDLVVASPDGVQVQTATVHEAASLIDPNQPCLVAVALGPTVLVTASEQTVDNAINAKLPPLHSFRVESLGGNLFQAFALDDELFEQIRSLGKHIQVVPYSVAVREMVSRTQVRDTRTGQRRRTQLTQVNRGTAAVPGDEISAKETVVVDAVEGDFLITALRDREVVAVRRVRGGDPVVELQRTLAAYRMGTPQILCGNAELTAELQARGFAVSPTEPGLPMQGWPAIESVTQLRFLKAEEVARERAKASRKAAVAAVAVSAGLLAVAAGVCVFFLSLLRTEEQVGQQLNTEKGSRIVQLAELYAERYPAVAKKNSVRLDDSFFDLGLVLPPQVNLVSVEKLPAGTNVVIERRADAAPFGKQDLLAALRTSGLKAATVREEFDGHIVRFYLTLPATPPLAEQAAVPPASTGP